MYKREVRNYIKQNTNHNNTSIILINPSELYINTKNITWEDENKELVYNGILYDIVNIKNQNGKVLIAAISDMRELEIKREFAENFSGKSEGHSHHSLKLLKQFLALKYLSSDESLELQNNLMAVHYQINGGFKPESGFVAIETLPPNYFV